MKKTLFFMYIIFIMLPYYHAFTQNNDNGQKSPTSSFHLGWASTSSQNISSIDAMNLGFSFPMFCLLKSCDLSVDWLVNGYSPIGRRDSLNFDGAVNFGIGLNYRLYIKSKNSITMSAYPLVSYSFYENNSNQFSFLAFQFDVKLPILYTSEGSSKLDVGFSYTSNPAIYKEKRANYDFASLYLSLHL